VPQVLPAQPGWSRMQQSPRKHQSRGAWTEDEPSVAAAPLADPEGKRCSATETSALRPSPGERATPPRSIDEQEERNAQAAQHSATPPDRSRRALKVRPTSDEEDSRWERPAPKVLASETLPAAGDCASAIPRSAAHPRALPAAEASCGRRGTLRSASTANCPTGKSFCGKQRKERM